MSATVIGKRYATALLNLAEKDKSVEKTGSGLEYIAGAIAESERLKLLLVEPKLTQAQRDSLLKEIFKLSKAPALIDTFLRFLSSKRRLDLLEDIHRSYQVLADEKLGRARATITLAVPIEKKEQEALRKKLEKISGKNVSLEMDVDPTILGGAVARIGSLVLDGSLRNNLDQIRNSIIEG